MVMIKKELILDCLNKEGLEEIDEIAYKNNIFVFNFFYAFDSAELDAARAYADQNYNEAEGEENWNEEYFLPYLTEMAAENISDIIEEMCGNNNLVGEFMVYELERSRFEKCEFTIVIAEKGVQFDIEKIMDELEL
jgi:hypothetical protein